MKNLLNNSMAQKTKLTLALDHISELEELLTGNEWEHFLYGKLISLRVELERQLSLVTIQELSQTP